jgi:hypothetical protein
VAGIQKLNQKSPFLPNDAKRLKKLLKELNYFEKKAFFEQKTVSAYGVKEQTFGKAKNQFFVALKQHQILTAKQEG